MLALGQQVPADQLDWEPANWAGTPGELSVRLADGSAITVGRPRSACSRICIFSGSAPR